MRRVECSSSPAPSLLPYSPEFVEKEKFSEVHGSRRPIRYIAKHSTTV